MLIQMQLKILAFDEHDVFAAIHSESALYMIGAVDEVKAHRNEVNAHNKEVKHAEQPEQVK
ncbi:MAG: hypothetical protein WBM99_06850 [Psychromonas sp.]